LPFREKVIELQQHNQYQIEYDVKTTHQTDKSSSTHLIVAARSNPIKPTKGKTHHFEAREITRSNLYEVVYDVNENKIQFETKFLMD
jgi:hypothetical protein